MQNRVTVVIGKKGSGKSTLVSEIVAEESRVQVIDSLAEYEDCEISVGLEDCLEALVKAEKRKQYRIALRCLALEDNLDLLRTAYELRESTLVVEETSLYCSAHSLPDEMSALIRYGRHQELNLVFVARRPSELHRDLTANADVLVTFRQQEPRDLAYLRSFYGDEALTLPTLPDYHIKVFGDLSAAPDAVLHRLASQGEPRNRLTREDTRPSVREVDPGPDGAESDDEEFSDSEASLE